MYSGSYDVISFISYATKKNNEKCTSDFMWLNSQLDYIKLAAGWPIFDRTREKRSNTNIFGRFPIFFFYY